MELIITFLLKIIIFFIQISSSEALLLHLKQDAIDAYASSHQPRAKVYKLLEPRVSIHHPDKWVVETDNKLAFLRIDGTVVYGLRVTDTTGYFPAYTSALFHKLRYERLNKGV